MIIYTPIALEDVLQNHQESMPERESIMHEGRMFYIERQANGDYQLVRLVSTDPNDYLNQNYEPGSLL